VIEKRAGLQAREKQTNRASYCAPGDPRLDDLPGCWEAAITRFHRGASPLTIIAAAASASSADEILMSGTFDREYAGNPRLKLSEFLVNKLFLEE